MKEEVNWRVLYLCKANKVGSDARVNHLSGHEEHREANEEAQNCTQNPIVLNLMSREERKKESATSKDFIPTLFFFFEVLIHLLASPLCAFF